MSELEKTIVLVKDRMVVLVSHVIEKQEIVDLEIAKDRFLKALHLIFKRGEDIRKEGEEVLYIVLILKKFYRESLTHNPPLFFDACITGLNYALVEYFKHVFWFEIKLTDSELRDDMDLDLLGVGSPEIEEFMVKEGLIVYKE